MMMAEGYNELTKALSRALLVLAYVIIAAAARYRRPTFCDTKQENDPVSFLWALKRDPPAYFFGTIHVPYTRVWDHIPDNMKQAFEQAENVFFELDLMDPYTIAALASCQMLPSGKNLADVLPGEMYQRLKRHLDYVKVMMPTWMTADQRGRGLYAEYLFNAITGNWEKKRPVWVMLMVNSLTESDVKSRGIPVLDLYLAQEAQRMDKRSGAVEKVEEQCVPLNGLNFTQVLFALNQTLYQQESMRSGEVQSSTYTTDDLIKHYNCGDLDSVIFSQDTAQVPHLLNNVSLPAEELLLARNIDHYFRQELIYKRNRRMGERVVQLLQTYPDESFFFAFGAGHFLGNNTVLDYVQSRGFLVEPVPPNKKLKSYKKTPHHQHHHHLHHRHKGATSVIHPDHSVSTFSSSDLSEQQQQSSWEEDTSRSGRRRYRKRQNFHQGVSLLRTSTTAPPKQHQRTFNDLWVKLDDHTRSAAKHLPTTEATQEMEDFQKHLRVWYGLPNSAAPHMRILSDSRIWFYVCILLLWTLFHRGGL